MASKFPFIIILIAILVRPLCAERNAVEYRGTQYVSLDALLDPEFLNGSVEMTYWGRNLVVDYDDQRVIFENGGDQLRDADGATHYLAHPILVLEGKHFLPIEECASVLGYIREANSLEWKDQRLDLEVESVLKDYPFRRIGKVTPIHRSVEVREVLPVYTMLPPAEPSHRLEPGEKLLVRRRFLLDGFPWVIAARNCPENFSVAMPEIALYTLTSDVATTGTFLFDLKNRARELAALEQGFCHGPRDRLAGEVALTADLCWSLREFEREFYDGLQSLTVPSARKVYCTQFITGRWLQQYPEAMADFLALEDSGKVDFIWALHSWDHPKTGDFMNAYAPESLRGDTLHLEKLMLEWGIVPEHFYRFPGLTHDRERLKEITSLDLIPTDCDSWVSGMRSNRPPHRMSATDGSILLVHGNGNEASGIRRFGEWWDASPTWKFGPIWDFVKSDVDQSALFADEGESGEEP